MEFLPLSNKGFRLVVVLISFPWVAHHWRAVRIEDCRWYQPLPIQLPFFKPLKIAENVRWDFQGKESVGTPKIFHIRLVGYPNTRVFRIGGGDCQF